MRWQSRFPAEEEKTVRRLTIALASCALVLSLAACAGTAPRQSTVRDRNVITAADMKAQNFTNVYDAIAALRSNWLTPRGTDSFNNPTPVRVYFDTADMGTVQALRTIAPSAIGYVRYYDANEATARWGVGHGQGVIFVSSYTDDRKF
jgi:hypothetical protein